MRGLTSSWRVSSTSITQAWTASPSCGAARPTPGRVAHRVGEVVEQLVQVLAEAVDRLALRRRRGSPSMAIGRTLMPEYMSTPQDGADVRCSRHASLGAQCVAPCRSRRRAPRCASVRRCARACRGRRVVSSTSLDRTRGCRQPRRGTSRRACRWHRPSRRRPCGRAGTALSAAVATSVGGLGRELAHGRAGLLGEVFDGLRGSDSKTSFAFAAAPSPASVVRSMPPRLPSSGRGVGIAAGALDRLVVIRGGRVSHAGNSSSGVSHRPTNEAVVREPGRHGRIIGATDDPPTGSPPLEDLP